MVVSQQTLQSLQQRYLPTIETALRETLDRVHAASGLAMLDEYYGQMRYHLGWVDASLAPLKSQTGKLLRPILLLLAYEAARAGEQAPPTPGDPAHLRRALPAAVAIELTHRFTLIHDDIEDGDAERHHRPTLWNLWGIPQAINTGDGMYALSRLALWDALDHGVECGLVVRLAALLDRTVQRLAEGQHLDLSFETRQDVSVALYQEMIQRKTAALMSCAAEMGALLGTHEQEMIERLRTFGQAIGIAFQVRDDILGVWATTAELGKTAAGDLYRRKKSLPILHALEQASEQDKQVLHHTYQQKDALTEEQVNTILAVFERTQTKQACCAFLAEQCRLAYETLVTGAYSRDPIVARAFGDLEVLVAFVNGAAHA